MEFISVFDVFKIGVGPSSSHTLGPWKAARSFMKDCIKKDLIQMTSTLKVSLFGSLSLTGKGHATDLAILMGLSDYDPETVDTEKIESIIFKIKDEHSIEVSNGKFLKFDPQHEIVFEKEFLSFHANGMVFTLKNENKPDFQETYYSIGGGFLIKENESDDEGAEIIKYPYPIDTSKQLMKYCEDYGLSISEVVIANESVTHTKDEYETKLLKIWETMLDSIYVGCHTQGFLPGALAVKRRAAEVVHRLSPNLVYSDKNEWLQAIRTLNPTFNDIIKWVSSFGISVNEVNAAFGRVVTAPTNGSAGVIPAVLMYYLCFVNKEAGDEEIIKFLSTSAEIGSIFKKGSTISAAMGGCQAEIGVSSSMAAAGLSELIGGSPEQCTIAAEIAMEHHLGMTCDPIGGLVQVPCIERNSMGAIKAINAASIATDRNPKDVKVTLDQVIKTMWETAQDMNRKYKETSEGGLATAVNIVDC